MARLLHPPKRLDPPVDATGWDLSSAPFSRVALMTKRLTALLCHTLDDVCHSWLGPLGPQGLEVFPAWRITPGLRRFHAVEGSHDYAPRRISLKRGNLSSTDEELPTKCLHSRWHLRRKLIEGRLVDDLGVCDDAGGRLGPAWGALNRRTTESGSCNH